VRILLAEDDTSLRDTIAEALRGQGYDVTAVGNGAAAREALNGAAFDGAILDGLLPKMTGFDVAKQIRATAPQTGVVLMSGVFKGNAQQTDQLQQTGAKAYLVKPFELQRLFDSLRSFAPPPASSSGAPQVVDQQPIANEGNLLETPPVYLGWRIQHESHTGILELFGSAERGRIFAYKGRAIFAQHSDAMLHVGIELLKDGTLSPEQFKEAADLAVARSVGLYEVLKSEGLATEAQLKLAYKLMVPKIIERLACLTGKYRWSATDAFTSIVPAASASIVDSMFTGVGKAADKDLEPHVAPRRPLRLAPGDQWAEVCNMLVASVGSDSLTRAINGRATVAQLLEVAPTPRERLVRLRQVYLLMSTMAVRASLEPIPMARAVSVADDIAAVSANQAQPAPAQAAAVSSPSGPAPSMRFDKAAANAAANAAADAGISFNAADTDARARISAKIAELAGKNHWDVLGAPRDADANALKKAYFALSRDFHPDSFAGLQLGSSQRQLEDVFSMIQEAYAVLTDPAKRGEYEAKTSLEVGGGSSDIGAIFAAESDFNRVKNLVERGELVSAAKLMPKVVSVLATSEEARGYKLFLDWWAVKNTATAGDIVRELQNLNKLAPAAHSLTEFQGWIHLETGNLKGAKGAFKRVLDVDARSAGADRGMRAVTRKQEEMDKAASSGLGRLFKR
jgi:CheY-like chemotaxis protein